MTVIYLLTCSTRIVSYVASLGVQAKSIINAKTKVRKCYTLEIIDSVSLSFYIVPNGFTAVPANVVSIIATT